MWFDTACTLPLPKGGKMFNELFAAYERLTDVDQEIKDGLLKFLRRLDVIHSSYGRERAADMVQAFNAGFHCSGGIVPIGLMNIQLKLDLMRQRWLDGKD
jgi:hypothetical protein